MKLSTLSALSLVLIHATASLCAENAASSVASGTTASADLTGGTLGVNAVHLYGMLEKCDFDEGGNGDYWGFGIGASRNLIETSSGLGLDASIKFETWRNKSSGAENRYQCDTYTLSATSYLRRGHFTPFATLFADREDTTSATVKGKGSTYAGLKAGLEWLPANRWHITPSITCWYAVESDDSSDYTMNYRLEAGYRITESVSLLGGLNYGDSDGYDQYWCDLGVLWRY
jgi:hypothetical protein